MCADMCTDMCTDMRTDTDACTDMCADMCTSMCRYGGDAWIAKDVPEGTTLWKSDGSDWCAAHNRINRSSHVYLVPRHASQRYVHAKYEHSNTVFAACR